MVSHSTCVYRSWSPTAHGCAVVCNTCVYWLWFPLSMCWHGLLQHNCAAGNDCCISLVALCHPKHVCKDTYIIVIIRYIRRALFVRYLKHAYFLLSIVQTISELISEAPQVHHWLYLQLQNYTNQYAAAKRNVYFSLEVCRTNTSVNKCPFLTPCHHADF